MQHFLIDENGHADSVEVCCLKRKVGSDTLFVLKHQLTYLTFTIFNLTDVILRSKFDIPEYQSVVEHFNNVKNLQRSNILYYRMTTPLRKKISAFLLKSNLFSAILE